MSDECETGRDDEPERCATVGCENSPVKNGYCQECADISPGILDTDDGAGAEKGHRASDVSPNGDKPERETGESNDSGIYSPVEASSADANPGFEAEESAARAREAFADAVAWFHVQLHRDISHLGLTYVDGEGEERTVETPREWFREVRGWADATIDDKRLGWASPHRTGLLDHLMREGYGRAAILGTGLFTEDLRPLWQGRFVFPYFDSDGQPVYAISRATGDECDDPLAGVPPSDHFITEACDEAYHKLGKINSAEGESHLPAGGSTLLRTCFFPAQDNIVCHSPSYSYGLLSAVTARAATSLGHDGSPGRQRWNDGAYQ